MAFDLRSLFSALGSAENTVPPRVVGIDIGSASIKVVELEQTEKALVLRSYGELQLGPYGGKELGEIVTLEPAKLTEALVDVLRESNIQAKHGVLAIPLDSSFVTVAAITVRSGESLDSKIRVEARKYIPVPLAEVTLNWSEINSYGDKESSVHEILLAAIQNTELECYQTLMGSVQMSSQPSEIEVFGNIRSLFKRDDTSLGVIDMGAETTKLYIVREGALERLHRVYDGGSMATKRIADMATLSFEAAENAKRSYDESLPNARDLYRCVMSGVERSAQEFKRVIEQYEARLGAPIGRFVVVGGTVNFPGVDKKLAEILNRSVERGLPFNRVAYPAFMEDTLKEIGVSFSVALGAALRPYEFG